VLHKVRGEGGKKEWLQLKRRSNGKFTGGAISPSNVKPSVRWQETGICLRWKTGKEETENSRIISQQEEEGYGSEFGSEDRRGNTASTYPGGGGKQMEQTGDSLYFWGE